MVLGDYITSCADCNDVFAINAKAVYMGDPSNPFRNLALQASQGFDADNLGDTLLMQQTFK